MRGKGRKEEAGEKAQRERRRRVGSRYSEEGELSWEGEGQEEEEKEGEDEDLESLTS